MSGDLPVILTSDRVFKATLEEFNKNADNLRDYFESMQDVLRTIHHNETAGPVITPTPTHTTLFSGPAILPPSSSFITREEVEEFKRAALAELDLDYIPRVLAECREECK